MYEAGFKGFNLRDQLTSIGVLCFVLPPHLLMEPKLSRVKTDMHDARKIALLLESGSFSACRVPDRERREDRQIVRTLNAIDKEIKATRNRIRKFFDFHGIDPGVGSEQWSKGDFRSLRALHLSESLKVTLGVYLDLLEMLWNQQTILRKELCKLCKKQRYAKAVTIAQSFPGIGWLSAIRLILELGENIATFSSGKAFAAFLGLTGRECSTGETVRKGRITGMGSTFVRS